MISIERADRADLGAISDLLIASSLPLQGVAAAIDQFLVAKADDRLLGCIGLELYGESALLRSAAVRSDARGQGIGRMLVDRIIDSARQQGAITMYLLTTTADEYFSKLGFVQIPRDAVAKELNASEELKGACPASAIVMRMTLS